MVEAQVEREKIHYWRSSIFFQNKYLPYLYAVLSIMMWATAPVFFKMGVSSLGFEAAVFWFLLFGGAYLILANIKKIKTINLRKFLFYSLAIGAATAIHYLTFVKTIMSSQPVSLTATLVNTSPLFELVFAFFLLQTSVSRKAVFGICACFFGAVIVSTNLQFQSFQFNIYLLLPLVAAVAWGFVLVLTRRSNEEESLITGAGLLWATIFVLFFVFYSNESIVVPKYFSELMWLIYLGIGPTAIAVAIWAKAYKLIGNHNAAKVIIFQYLKPILTVMTALLFLQETVSFIFVIGLLFIVIGNFLCLKSKDIKEVSS